MESPATAARLAFFRDKVQRGEKLTAEEQAEVVRIVREDRKTASVVSATSKSAKAPADPAATLAKLNDLLKKKMGG